MKIVKFQETKNRFVYINIDKIEAFRKVKEHSTMIITQGRGYHVLHSVEEVMHLINN